MYENLHFEKAIKTSCIGVSTAFFTTLTAYWVLDLIFHIEVYYVGMAMLVLLAPFLLSIAYAMALYAKRALDKGIERNQELKMRIDEMTTEEKEINQ